MTTDRPTTVLRAQPAENAGPLELTVPTISRVRRSVGRHAETTPPAVSGPRMGIDQLGASRPGVVISRPIEMTGRRARNATGVPAATETVPRVKTRADSAAGPLATAQPGDPVDSGPAVPVNPINAAGRPGNLGGQVARRIRDVTTIGPVGIVRGVIPRRLTARDPERTALMHGRRETPGPTAVPLTATVPRQVAQQVTGRTGIGLVVMVTGRTGIVLVVMLTGRTGIVLVVMLTGRTGIVLVVMLTGRTGIVLVVMVIGPTVTANATNATDPTQGGRRHSDRVETMSDGPTRTGRGATVSGPTATTPEGIARAVRNDRLIPNGRDATRVGRTRHGRRAMATGPMATGPTGIGPALIGPVLTEAVSNGPAARARRRTATGDRVIGRIAREHGPTGIGPTASVTRTSARPAGIVPGPTGIGPRTSPTVTGLRRPDPARSIGNHRSARNGRVATTVHRARTTVHRARTTVHRAGMIAVPAPRATGLHVANRAARPDGSRASAGPTGMIVRTAPAPSAAT